MFEIGASLQEARLRRGLSGDDVQKAIHIRERYLQALEEEHWELLPGDAYVKGFLRTYADFLGLDGSLYVDEFNSRFPHPPEPALVRDAAVPFQTSRTGLVRPLAAIAAIVAVVAGIAVWELHGSGGPASPRAHAPAAPPKPGLRRKAPPIRPAAAPTVRKPAPASALLQAATGRVWVLVRDGDANGTVVYQGVLEQGQTLRVALHPRVWLRVGAPASLRISIGGRVVAGLPTQPANLLLSASGLSPAG